MCKFTNEYLGTLSQVNEAGVFCKDAKGEGEERQVFTWKKPEDGVVRVPILSQITMTPDSIECYWGEPGRSPSMRFDRTSV